MFHNDIHTEVLVITQLTRARLVVVELHLPFVVCMFVNQPDHCLNWGHLGVWGGVTRSLLFTPCGSSLVILCATSMKRPDRVFALGKSADYKACAGIDDSRCCKSFFKNLL